MVNKLTTRFALKGHVQNVGQISFLFLLFTMLSYAFLKINQNLCFSQRVRSKLLSWQFLIM